MLNFFDTLIEYVQIVFQFFLNLINSLIHAVAVMTSSASLVVTLVGYMPYFISTAILIGLSVVVVNYLIGRSNQ